MTDETLTGRLYPRSAVAPTRTRTRFQKGTVVKRGASVKYWVGRVWEDVKLPSGDIKRKLRSFRLGTADKIRNEREARRALQPYLDRVNDISFRPTTAITFGDFAEQYESRMLDKEKKPSYRADLRSQLRRHLVPGLGRIELSRIDSLLVQKFIDGISPGRARNVFNTLMKLWQTACDWGYVEHKLEGIRLKPHVAKEPRYFTQAEVAAIILSADEPFKTVYWLTALTGVRFGEILALRYSDIDCINRTIRIDRSVWQGTFGEPKTRRSRRTIPISAKLALRIAAMSEMHAPDSLILPTGKGTPWRQSNLCRRVFHPLLKRLGIPKGSFHAFRHGNSTIMGSDGVNASDAVRMGRLGHSNISTTHGYTHRLADEDYRVAETLERLIGG